MSFSNIQLVDIAKYTRELSARPCERDIPTNSATAVLVLQNFDKLMIITPKTKNKLYQYKTYITIDHQ
jgi:hypothetical protein